MMKNLTSEAIGQMVGLDIRIETQDVLGTMLLFGLFVAVCFVFGYAIAMGPAGVCCTFQLNSTNVDMNIHDDRYCPKMLKAQHKAYKKARKAERKAEAKAAK
jgi:hypothetical protein